jgi:hypothetical protein
MRGITFVAMLFVGTICCLTLGGMALYERIQFWSDGQTGVMVSDDSLIQRAAKLGQSGPLRADVKYIAPSGETQVPQKFLTEDLAKRLADGEEIPVTFLRSNPQRVNFDNEPLSNPWGWLLAGSGLLALATYAWRLLRKEAAATYRGGAA